MATKSIAIERSIAESQLVDRAWFCIELTRYVKRTLYNQYSRKYKKIIHELISHVRSLVPLTMAGHRLARKMLRRYCYIFSYYCIIDNHGLGVTDTLPSICVSPAKTGFLNRCIRTPSGATELFSALTKQLGLILLMSRGHKCWGSLEVGHKP